MTKRIDDTIYVNSCGDADGVYVTVTPNDQELFDGFVLAIHFSAAGRSYGINSTITMGLNDWKRWVEVVEAALQDTASHRRTLQ
jgi:hypothetical protein